MIDYDKHPPQNVYVGDYQRHAYDQEGLLKFHVDIGDTIPEGSVFEGELVRFKDGWAEIGVFCVGYHSSMAGTYWTEVPASECSIYNEEKHDPIWAAKQWLNTEEGKQWLKEHPLPR